MNELSLHLSDLEPFLNKSHCSCHIINPSKTRIILWKEVKDSQTTYYLRIGIQKFISYPLTDKNNEVYWRFKVYEKPEVNSAEEAQPENQTVTNSTDFSELDPITKFKQRQEKVHAKPSPAESSVNSSPN